MTRTSTFYEFFAGGGMARLGLGDRWRCTFANDFDPVKSAAYLANFKDAQAHFQGGDVWGLTAKNLPGRADLAWASSPCQDFSLAGARAGLKGGRSSAFFGFWELIKQLGLEDRQPRTIVVENVVGLLTSRDGRDFAALCEAFADEGYRFGAVEIDAARFVPHSRPRVFVVATKSVVPRHLKHLEPVVPFHSKRVSRAFEQLPSKLQSMWVWWRLSYPPAHNETVEAVLEADEEVQWFEEAKVNHICGLLNQRNKAKLVEARKQGGRTVGTLFRRMRTEAGKKVQRAELRFDGFAGCLRTPGGGSSKQVVVVVEDGRTKIRNLTAREAARLMGLDDSYELPVRKNAALKICGDGVVVDVVAWLREELLDELSFAADENADGQEEGSRARA